MIRIEGRHNAALCYAATLEETAEMQIRTVCDQEAFADCRIRIMPDVHAGKGCTIGTTMSLHGKVVPAMVGVDIGCGMETVQLAETKIDLAQLDAVIRAYIPAGFQVRSQSHPLAQEAHLDSLRCGGSVDLGRALLSIGTLGGGNHFIEVDRDDAGRLYLVIHSGSRHLGTEVARWYQDAAWMDMNAAARTRMNDAIAEMKAEGRQAEIPAFLAGIDQRALVTTPKDLAYVEGARFDDYITDMHLTQHFAALSRKAMVDVILEKMGLHAAESFTTIHNYIDTGRMILRKGAVSAGSGERLLIPINMRDGSLICTGKGNDEWNCSAPHGAGRLLSRGQARKSLTIDQFRREMAGIYTTCVDASTLDESPMAYKPMEEIVRCITPTADIVQQIRPIYNFKAAG